MQEMMNIISSRKEELGITLYPPAYPYLIEVFEIRMGVKLPEEVRALYLYCNGFESEEDQFRIIPLEEIMERRKEFVKGQFYFAEYMLYCDMWDIQVDANDPDSYGIYNSSYNILLTNSLVTFLEHFVKGGVFEVGGLIDWQEKLEKTTTRVIIYKSRVAKLAALLLKKLKF